MVEGMANVSHHRARGERLPLKINLARVLRVHGIVHRLMSCFACETCGRTQVDKDGVGYVAGCSHHPPEGRLRNTFVTVWFGGDDETPARAFYAGAWYKSAKAKAECRAVHPVAWDAEHCHHGNVAEDCQRCLHAWQARYGGA